MSTWPRAIAELLAFRPFKSFYLVAGTTEWFVDQPNKLWIPLGEQFAVFGSDGTSDLINLSLVDHVRIDDDFGMVEAKQIWK